MWNRIWDTIFSDNEWGKYPPEDLIRFIARDFYAAPSRSDVRILEVGCGTGANLWYLAREGFRVTGIDGSRVGVERAAARLKAESLEGTVLVGDIVSLPFEDETFDCAIDIECLYANSRKDCARILSEIHRVLKPGGKLFSKTFMTGTTGEGSGPKLEGEENTYLELREGPLRQGCGLIRLTSEREIPELYHPFRIDSVDTLLRSEKNQAHVTKEWIIQCTKA
ncbi:MAG TPA: class I SAM-dependent methyltransferase [Elusimicrobia bacterium]|nr:class I SAM-dependent methyltransferase [Elusimicrobiota bacterium]